MTTFKLRRGTASAWTAANPTLAAGEPGIETDTLKWKVGDGSTTWNSLAYFNPGSASFATPSIALGSSAAGGAASTVIRSDATIAAFDATNPSTQAFGDAAAVGTAAYAARRDHKHAMPADPFTGATAGGVLDGTYPNPGLAAGVAGAGLAETSDVLSVNVDGSTIEINSDTLRVKASGITANEIGDAELSALAGLTSAARSFPYFTGSGTAALETRLPWTTVFKTGDESVSGSTTVQDDNELSFTGTSGKVYELWIELIYASPLSAGTPDLKVDFGEDGTDRGALVGIGRNASDTVVAAANRIAQGVTSTWGTAAINRGVTFLGNYYSAGGAFKVRWAQGTSDGNPTTVYTGSFLAYRLIG